MQQLSSVGVWAALLVAGLVPRWSLQEAGSETEVRIRTIVDQHFALMPESWRQEFSRRLAGRLDDPRVAASTRDAILKDSDRLIDT